MTQELAPFPTEALQAQLDTYKAVRDWTLHGGTVVVLPFKSMAGTLAVVVAAGLAWLIDRWVVSKRCCWRSPHEHPSTPRVAHPRQPRLRGCKRRALATARGRGLMRTSPA